MCVCVHACVRACVRACVSACVCVIENTLESPILHEYSSSYLLWSSDRQLQDLDMGASPEETSSRMEKVHKEYVS